MQKRFNLSPITIAMNEELWTLTVRHLGLR